ncbi:MAG TPA: hypothetical protein VLH09_04235 [Bryobacteraceae bacterium]|nr:hypothetical protein [Bryobacteraceae bacterium]
MAFCTNCGSSMEGPFCPKCGARAGAPAPQPVQPAAPAPVTPTPVAPPPSAPPKKTSPLIWVLVGCGGLVVIALLVLFALGFFVSRKASEFGKNPGFAAARMIASMNPNVDVVKADESTGKITLRDKKTGKTVTLDFQDIQKGRISFEGADGERVDIRGGGEGAAGSVTVEGRDGTMRFGQGSLSSVPSWVPRYPGAEFAGTFAMQSGNDSGGTFQLKCNDSVSQVAAYYEREMRNAGMKVEKHSMQADNRSVQTVVGSDDGSGRSVTASVGSGEGGTVITTIYQTNR